MDDLPPHARVAIVGGGFAGLATAWALAEAGCRDVVVLERESRLAAHASSHNAAMCRALAEDDAWTAWTSAGARWLRQPPTGFSPRPLVDDRGAILLTQAPAALAALAARHQLRCVPVTAAEVAARWPGLEVDHGGLWFPDDGCIDLDALTAGYVDGGRRRGVRYLCDAGVTAIRHDGDRAHLATARGPLSAALVIAAGGAWSGALGALAGVAGAFTARRRHLFSLRLTVDDAPIVWHVDAGEWYVRPAPGGVMASACDHDATAPGDVTVDPEVRVRLRARLPATLAAVPIERAWACQRTYADGGLPLIALDPDRPWWLWVAGLGGHGVTASAAIGQAAAACALAAPPLRAPA
ncbi:MAG: FAD-binding oxidoreductase [Kofleriaceae bacterium]